MDYGADGSYGSDVASAPGYQGEQGQATINMDKLRRIQASIPVQDPSAPLGSNKNPIRIIQQGNQFITTQKLSDEQLNQITQVLHNQSILSEVQKSGTGGARVQSPASKSLFQELDNSGGAPAAKRRRGKRSQEEEDPDFDPIAEEEGRKPGRYLYPEESVIFQCDSCDLQFMSRQALLKHVQLRHEQREGRRAQYVPLKKRSALKAAMKTSSDEEVVDICLPRLAKLANPFDFLLVKSERGDPPLPNLAMLVDDLVNLVDISRKFLKEHLVRLPAGERPYGSVNVDNQAKADVLGLEVGNYGVRATFNEGYLPPRHRVSLQQHSRRNASQTLHEFGSARYAEVNADHSATVHTSDSGFEISMKIGPKSAVSAPTANQPTRQPQQPVITDKDIASERYFQVLDENGLPSEFVIEAATGQFFNRVTGEPIAVMQEQAEPEQQQQQQQQQQAEDKAADAQQPAPAAGDDKVAAGEQPAAGEQQQQQQQQSADDAAPEQQQQQQQQQQQMTSATTDTGEPVQIDLSTMFPGVTLQDLNDSVLLITKPDGSTLQVEHGGQGITLEFLQELLNTQFE